VKPRIFIAIQYLEIGGAERSLIGLLNAFDYSRVDVDLFVYEHRGEFMSLIPKEVNLLPENKVYAAINRPIKDIVKEGRFAIAAARLLAKVKYAFYCKREKPREGSAIFQYVADCVTPLLPSLRKYGEYDLAISFLTPHNIVLEKVRAKKKVAWIHTDYSYIQVDAQCEKRVWLRYDHIVSISESVTAAFLKVFPEAEDKIVLVENILSPAFVRRQATAFDANKEMPQTDGIIRLLSVGRFSSPKNFDNVPSICRRLRELGMNVKWYIIGFGGDEALIRQRIREEKMQDYVILLGKKDNPYPYMAACDIYVQPSRYEGKAVTVREAQILGKPVIITRFPTSASQLKDGVDGVIVPMGVDEAAAGIANFIEDKDKQTEIKKYLRTHNYGNEAEVEKVLTFS